MLQQEELHIDALLEVVANNQPMLLHIEFQTRNDKAMRERLLRYNILRDTPIFQEIMREGREEGLLEGARHTLLLVVQARFPKLEKIAEDQMKRIEDVHVLEEIIFKVAAATTILDATHHLLDWEDSEQES